MAVAVGSRGGTLHTKKYNKIKVLSSNVVPLYKKLNMYLKTVRLLAFGIWYFDNWQINDIKFVIKDMQEVMLLRNRGGSKTRDSTIMAVFFGYQRNDVGDFNRVLWYSASETQIEVVKGYFAENRYVKKATTSKVYLWNGNVIQLRIMSEKQAVSPRSDIIFFDEEQSMDEKIYRMALGTMVGGTGKKIHCGTTELETILHNNFERLEPLGRVLEHHVDELSWTTVEKELELYAGEPEFVIQSQLFCQWVRAGGVIFENVECRDLTEEEMHNLIPGTFLGLDPNPKSGHALVGIKYLNDAYDSIYVYMELDSKQAHKEYQGDDLNDSEVFSLALENLLVHNAYLEIEENAGEEFIKTFKSVTQDARIQGSYEILRWNEENKMERIIGIRKKRRIIISPTCKETLKHVRSAVFDPKQPKAKLLKSPDQHFLDGFIHACSRDNAIRVVAY